jgi:hypothetical protein
MQRNVVERETGRDETCRCRRHPRSLATHADDVRDEDRMRFTFTIKTRSGAVTTIEVEAPDQKAADEKVKRENPTCVVVKVEKR